MRLFKQTLPVRALTLVLTLSGAFTSTLVNAQTTAITNATVYTATDKGILTNATVVIENGKITAINPPTISADIIVDAKGKILTPGFIGSMNQLGLVEVGAVSRTRDASDKKADITFDASLAFNPQSTVIPYSRKGGITRNVVTPRGGESMFKGHAFAVNLSASFNSVTDSETAVLLDLGSKSKGSRAYELQMLSHKLEDAAKKLTKLKNKSEDKGTKKKSEDEDKKDDEPKRDEIIINSLLAGEKPLLVYADRATDLLALIDLKKQFNLKLIIVGAADAELVSEQLAKENVSVILNALRNLPGSFDSLHTSLSSAANLTAAGVKVILSVNDTHNIYQLRFNAGNAIANGLSKKDALASITANVADSFALNTGRIAIGYDADLVLWSADPFELSSKVDKMWIIGEQVSTQSRQDALRHRYTTNSEMPRAYTK
ncbi:MAG: amidohydrolase family protein [Colwellia sp.]|nr:amidohydrolase family protein [Colwellia sp.]